MLAIGSWSWLHAIFRSRSKYIKNVALKIDSNCPCNSTAFKCHVHRAQYWHDEAKRHIERRRDRGAQNTRQQLVPDKSEWRSKPCTSSGSRHWKSRFCHIPVLQLVHSSWVRREWLEEYTVWLLQAAKVGDPYWRYWSWLAWPAARYAVGLLWAASSAANSHPYHSI